MLLSQAKTDFRAFLETEGRRPKTITKYTGILDRFITFAGERKASKLAAVDLSLIDKYREFRKPSLSPKSMHHEGALLKLFFAWCEERKLIAENPLGQRRFSPPDPKARKAPSLANVNAILKSASDLRRPHFALLAFCGARSGEARNLLIEDVDVEGAWIHIRSRKGAETKNGEDRKVPMHPRLRRLLESLPRGGSGWFFKALASNRYPAGDHHINVKRLNEDLGRIMKRLDLPTGRDSGFTVHSFRRFFRTRAVNSGVPERVVDLWLGHKDKKSMGTIYYDLSDEESQQFMKQVDFSEDV